MFLRPLSILVLAVGIPFASGAQGVGPSGVSNSQNLPIVTPSTAPWQDPPLTFITGIPSVPPGGIWHMAILQGDPASAGNPYALRLSCTDGARIAPHRHPGTVYVTVLRGAISVGVGSAWNDAALKEVPAGGFFTAEPRVSHFLECKDDTILQIQGDGPFQVDFLSPGQEPVATPAASVPPAGVTAAKQLRAPDAKAANVPAGRLDAAAEDQTGCMELQSLKLDHVFITSALPVPENSLRLPLPTGGLSPAIALPAFCRVQGVMAPTADSHIAFEVWMPLSDWNGRFEQLGNGGYAGLIPYVPMIPELRKHFAVASTDDGHTAGPDQSWAIGHPEKVIDFGNRAVHDLSGTAKEIIHKFYTKAPSYSYFNGCSDGGREALMEAQRYPDDFNGIVAGAPAAPWTNIMAGFAWNEQALLKNQAGYIPQSKLPAIQAAVLGQCDALDGVKDGLLENPRDCHFDPAVMQCKGEDGPGCLTAPQVITLRKIYSGPKDPVTGRQIAPGFEPGTEAPPSDWPTWIIGHWPGGGVQFSFANQFFTDMVFENPKWDFRTFDFHKDVTIADTKLGPVLNATNPDLRKFKAHGGRLVQYHGWADAAVAPLNSVQYYQAVTRKMGGLKSTQDFYRLFMVPGMTHCGGGPGPTEFTGPGGKNDVVSLVTQWVEHDVAPTRIIVSRYQGDNPKNPVAMTRPLCPFPKQAKWIGKGSTNDAANFVCR